MAKTLGQLHTELLKEMDGSKFNTLKSKIIKHFSQDHRKEVLAIFIQYAKEGRLLHWRNFLLTDIIALVEKDEGAYAAFFEWTITQPELTYWGIDGLLKTKGKQSYEALIKLASDESVVLSCRAKAIKSLSLYARQNFDRGLVKDPGYWKKEDLRLGELLAWQQQAYPDGKGYQEPTTHPSLKNPQTELERVAAKLDQKLQIKRQKRQDLSNPSDWLALASSDKMAQIMQQWTLPKDYLLFLTRYSPIRVCIIKKAFSQGLWLYGADDLMAFQAGYAYNGITKEVVMDWPKQFVVIADDGGDPYCIDIDDPKGSVYTSMHGMGAWDFEKYADSFIDFLKQLAK